MAQEDKNLLLKDLCARLPYGVKFAITNKKTDTLKSIGITKFDLIPINLFYKKPSFYLINEFGNIEYKPYLRPMSGMTEGERREYNSIVKNTIDFYDCPKSEKICFFIMPIDWLNAHHFDYRGLIEKGLALPAPPDIYNLK